jgi:hypothetical protein
MHSFVWQILGLASQSIMTQDALVDQLMTIFQKQALVVTAPETAEGVLRNNADAQRVQTKAHSTSSQQITVPSSNYNKIKSVKLVAKAKQGVLYINAHKAVHCHQLHPRMSQNQPFPVLGAKP